MKILITGGAGYIGRAVTKILLPIPEVDEVISYDNLSRGNNNCFIGSRFEYGEKLRLVEGELLDTRKLQKSLAGVDVVIHLAARVTTPFANTDPHFFEQTNHWGTAELVYAVENTDVNKLIYVSSTAVYGPSTEKKQETSSTNPTTYYGISKLRGEDHVRRLGETKNSIVLRLGNIYGFNDCMRFDAVINRFLFDANFKRRIQIHGSGLQYRAFIHIDHAAKLLRELVVNSVPTGTYHAVDRNLQILEIADELRAIYPDLELLFADQHMKLPELRVSTNTCLKSLIDFPIPGNLPQELLEFQKCFSF